MAIVTTKSSTITNRDATPVVLANDYLAKSVTFHATGVVAAANGDSIGSSYKFASIPSNAYIMSVILANDAITGASATIDLYDTTANGGAIVPSTGSGVISTAISVATATTDRFTMTVSNANSEKRVWELLGLSADPVKYYDVVMTLTAAATAAGSISLSVLYSQ